MKRRRSESLGGASACALRTPPPVDAAPGFDRSSAAGQTWPDSEACKPPLLERMTHHEDSRGLLAGRIWDGPHPVGNQRANDLISTQRCGKRQHGRMCGPCRQALRIAEALDDVTTVNSRSSWCSRAAIRYEFMSADEESTPVAPSTTAPGASAAAIRELIRDEVRTIVREEITAALKAGADPVGAESGSAAAPAELLEQPAASERGGDLAQPQPHDTTEPDHPEHRPGHSANLPARSTFGRKVFWRLEGEERVAYRHLWPEALGVWNAWASGDAKGPKRLDALDPSHRAQVMAALGLRWSPPPSQDGQKLLVQPLRSGGDEESPGELMVQRMTAAISGSEMREPHPPQPRPAFAQQELQAPKPVVDESAAARAFGTLLGWLLILSAAVAVVYAQVNGRTSAFGVTVEAEWLQPVSWGAVAAGVIGLGLLIAGKNTRHSSRH